MSAEEVDNLKRQVDRIISHLESELGTRQDPGNVPQAIKDVSAKVDSLCKAIRDPDGLMWRVAVLERADKRRDRMEKWFVSVTASAILGLLGLIAMRVWELILSRT